MCEKLQINLISLVRDYGVTVGKRDYNCAQNIMKNIEMVIRVLRDINENKNALFSIENMSELWNFSSSQDKYDVSKFISGERYCNDFNELVKKYGKLMAIRFMCFNENLYYHEDIGNYVINNSSDELIPKNYKRQ